MRLKTKLVLAATATTFTIVLVLSVLFLSELLRQRIDQTAGANDLMVRQVLMMTRQAVTDGLRAHPPTAITDESLQAAVVDALKNSEALNNTMGGLFRYSPAVQDVSITDASGRTLLSTDPQMLNQPAADRMSFTRVRDASVLWQARQMFGRPRVLDVSAPLDRNGKPFLMVHVGVRSTFLTNTYIPWFKAAFLLSLFGGLIAMLAAGLLASMALRPLEEISRRLERLTRAEAEGEASGLSAVAGNTDAVLRVTRTLDRLDRQIQTTAAGYTDLQANLDRMLDTLRDGVVLFTSEGRAVMVSDAVANFIVNDPGPWVGRLFSAIFPPDTALGEAVLRAFQAPTNISGETVRLEDGREVEIVLDRVDDRGRTAVLLTLRDKGSAQRLEQELEVSRRLAAVGRLTAGVGHEVKNPINAMVVHLELLRSKLEIAGNGRAFLGGAMHHVEVISGEMHRLDRVVQTLADFTRPMELRVEELDLSDLAMTVLALTDAEMAERGIALESQLQHVAVRGDGEMLRQALLNLVLNGMQAMEEQNSIHGRHLRLSVGREHDLAVIQIQDEGPGIAQDILPRIFDLYFTTKSKGSGIGLSMSYRIVQMHGGSMDVSSEPGQGATFTVRLPALPATDSRGSIRLAAGRAA